MRGFVTWVVGHRWWVIGATFAVTVLLGLQIRNLELVVDTDTMLPADHPYVAATRRIEELFGSKYVLVVGVTPQQGDAYQPLVLQKIDALTRAFAAAPGVRESSLMSLASRKAKNIVGSEEGMEVRAMMDGVPATAEELAALRRAVAENPVYQNSVVSRDGRTTTLIAEFEKPADGFRAMMTRVHAIVDRERDPRIRISIGGMPAFLAELEKYSARMGLLFPLAVLIVGLIHYEAFRTVQGLVLPLVTALLAVVWGLGVMAAAKVPLDVFNVTTPILILAVAAGHAVQILKRYYEEYDRLRDGGMAPFEANSQAVIDSIAKIGPVMITAGIAAALSFFSLLSFRTATIRTFGVFTALGILAALVLEMTFIPALRSRLAPPGERERAREGEERFWDRITSTIAGWVVDRRGRLYAVIAAVVLVSLFGASRVRIENSNKSYFFDSLPFVRDDDFLNQQLGGTNTVQLLVEAGAAEAIQDPAVLRAIDAAQRRIEREPHVGKTISLADFVRRMNRAMHADDPAFDVVPESRELIAQYLLLYSMSGDPTDFDTYVDTNYQNANVRVLVKTDSTSGVEAMLAHLRHELPATFPRGVKVSTGGSMPDAAALNEVMVHGKVRNIVQIALVILVVTTIVFRSPVGGLLVLVPLAFAVLGTFGLMGLSGITMNIATSIISAMAVGIGADYAIYLIFRYREELAKLSPPDGGGNEEEAMRATLKTAGKAILFVASAVAGGYGVLVLSWGFYIHVWFAILIAAAMLMSSLGALTILPSLILSVRPRFIFGSKAAGAAAPTPALWAGLLLAGGLLAGGVFAGASAAAAAPADPREVMEKSFMVGRVADSSQNATFTLIAGNGQKRVRETMGVTKLQQNGVDNMRMVRFTTPKDVAGTVILTIEHGSEDDMWVYLPALGRVRRLVASNKKDSFAGTDFTYGDVIGHKVADWTYKLLREETVDGAPTWVIESLPKSPQVASDTGYGRRISWVRQDNYVLVKGENYNARGELERTFHGTEVTNIDPKAGKWQALRLEMTNVKTKHTSVIAFSNFRANVGVSDDYFTTRYMERP
jgi:hypothetical protein